MPQKQRTKIEMPLHEESSSFKVTEAVQARASHFSCLFLLFIESYKTISRLNYFKYSNYNNSIQFQGSKSV